VDEEIDDSDVRTGDDANAEDTISSSE